MACNAEAQASSSWAVNPAVGQSDQASELGAGPAVLGSTSVPQAGFPPPHVRPPGSGSAKGDGQLWGGAHGLARAAPASDPACGLAPWPHRASDPLTQTRLIHRTGTATHATHGGGEGGRTRGAWTPPHTHNTLLLPCPSAGSWERSCLSSELTMPTYVLWEPLPRGCGGPGLPCSGLAYCCRAAQAGTPGS